MKYSDNAMMALHTLGRLPTKGIPTGMCHIMEHSVIERLAGAYPGSYENDPHGVYMAMQRNIGVCMLDQYIADNPLTMTDRGYESGAGMNAPTEGGGSAVVDGIAIKEPEDVVRHIEEFVVPRLKARIAAFSEAEAVQALINYESQIQAVIGGGILKAPYAIFSFPSLMYTVYGYEPYFSAYALYPDVMGRLFSLQADYAEAHNRAAVKAVARAGLPAYCRLDHDMADSRGTLCSVKSLEKLWFPHFERSIRPAADAGFALLWHCDGNLSEMVPLLLEAGVNGFQGFQYEDGMDYVKICKMAPKRGGELIIQAGVSVTRTLPFGKPSDVAREMRFLVENGTRHMFLSMSSSCVPGTPYENIRAFVEGLHYYRLNGRL